jgi:hypothetical protein
MWRRWRMSELDLGLGLRVVLAASIALTKITDRSVVAGHPALERAQRHQQQIILVAAEGGLSPCWSARR